MIDLGARLRRLERMASPPEPACPACLDGARITILEAGQDAACPACGRPAGEGAAGIAVVEVVRPAGAAR